MMQGQERTNDLPSPTRSKRGRPNNQDLDVELDNYFRSKRFMTETISKEMEDVAIAEPPITTSPSRSSAMSRLAEKGPSRSGVSSVLDFDAPKLSVSGSNNRRRPLVVTTAGEVPLNRSQSIGDMQVSSNGSVSMYLDEDEEEDAEEQFSSAQEWRMSSVLPQRAKTPMYLPVEDHLQRLIEKKKEVEAKSMVLYRSPSDLIKDAAQNALYAKVRSSSPSAPSPSSFASSAYYLSKNRSTSPLGRIPTTTRPSFPMASPTPHFGISPVSYASQRNHPHSIVVTDTDSDSTAIHTKAPILIEELPDDDETSFGNAILQDSMKISPPPQEEMMQEGILSPTASTSPMHTGWGNMAPTTPPRASFADYMMTDDSMGFVHTRSASNSPTPSYAPAPDSSHAHTPPMMMSGSGRAYMGGMYHSGNSSNSPPPPNYSFFNDSSDMDISSTPPPRAPEETMLPRSTPMNAFGRPPTPSTLSGFPRFR